MTDAVRPAEFCSGSSHGAGWLRRSADMLADALSDPKAPYVCPFANSARLSGTMKIIGFDPASGDWRNLATELGESWMGPGEDSSVVVVFGPPPFGNDLQQHRKQFWHILAQLVRHDVAGWPDVASRDLNNPKWSLHIAGLPVFAMGTSPYYQRRLSRRLTDTLAIVFQPLRLFQYLIPSAEDAMRTKLHIRANIQQRDLTLPHTYLGQAAESSLFKIRQYFLPDTDDDDFSVQLIASLGDAVNSALSMPERV